MSTIDAFLIRVRSTAARFGGLARKLTRQEAYCLVAGALYGVFLAAYALIADEPPVLAVAAAALLMVGTVAPVIADAVIMRDNLARLGAAVVKTNMAKPTGAPRVAEVTCRHGDHHRFVYGPTGWEAAGPAVEPPPVDPRSLADIKASE